MRCAWFRITKTRTGRKKEFSPDTTEKGSRKDRSNFIDGCLFALCCCGLFDACCVAAETGSQRDISTYATEKKDSMRENIYLLKTSCTSKLMINPDSVYKWPDKRNEHGAKETGKTEDSKKKRRGAFSKDDYHQTAVCGVDGELDLNSTSTNRIGESKLKPQLLKFLSTLC
ncbi:hypothetical protein ACOSQ2_019160 [Xanthoceras sorbifolium]